MGTGYDLFILGLILLFIIPTLAMVFVPIFSKHLQDLDQDTESPPDV